jgi:hypothetical protein
MSTDAQPDFSFGRTAGPIVRRLLSDDETFCPWSPKIITRVYVKVDDRYASKKVYCC